MAFAIAPLELHRDGHMVAALPSIALNSPGVIQVLGSDWLLAQAIVFAGFGFDEELVLDLGYEIKNRRESTRAGNTTAIDYVSPFPHSEVTLFWDTVVDEISLGNPERAHNHLFKEIVDALNLNPLLERRPDTLSGGETAKVILAAHLINEPEVLVVDRILGELDVQARANLLNHLIDLNRNLVLVAIDESFLERVSVYLDTSTTPVDFRTVPPLSLTSDSSSLFQYTRFTLLEVNTGLNPSKNYLCIQEFEVERNGKMLFGALNARIASGCLVWVLGSNGSGKTSFFEAILGLIRPIAGTVLWIENGILSDSSKVFAYSPQDPQADITELTLFEEVSLACEKAKALNDIKAWLFQAGLSERVLEAPLSEDLSLKKLASVLASLARSTKVCLLDEPTLFLSEQQRKWVIAATRLYMANGGIVLCATHDGMFFKELSTNNHLSSPSLSNF